MSTQAVPELGRCAADVYRGEWSTLRREPCGKPSKGAREIGGQPYPVCGIHLRARNIVVQVAPSRWKGVSR
jgi:hypothetical protein